MFLPKEIQEIIESYSIFFTLFEVQDLNEFTIYFNKLYQILSLTNQLNKHIQWVQHQIHRKNYLKLLTCMIKHKKRRNYKQLRYIIQEYHKFQKFNKVEHLLYLKNQCKTIQDSFLFPQYRFDFYSFYVYFDA